MMVMMSPILRNTIVFVIVTTVWAFFFVPNPLFSFLNVQGLDAWIPNLVLFGLIPFALAILCMVLTTGRLSGRVVISLVIPIVAGMLCLFLWGTGVYSDESLLGAWLYTLLPVPSYLAGIVVALLVLRRI
jgi:hypothetical protein